MDSQISVRATFHRSRHHLLDFLCDHAYVGCVPTVIDEAVNAKSIAEVADEHDVVLKPDVGSTSTPAAATAPAATAVMTAAAMAATAAKAAAMAATAAKAGPMATTADGSTVTAASAMTTTDGSAVSAPTGSTMTGMRTRFRRRSATVCSVLHAICSLAVSGVGAFATIAACRTSARTITQIVAAIARIENLLAVTSAEIKLAIAAIASAMLDMRVAVPIAAGPAGSIDGDVIIVPIYIATPIAS